MIWRPRSLTWRRCNLAPRCGRSMLAPPPSVSLEIYVDAKLNQAAWKKPGEFRQAPATPGAVVLNAVEMLKVGLAFRIL